MRDVGDQRGFLGGGHGNDMAYCMLNWPIVNRVSYIPVVFVRARKTSASVGVYVGPQIRVTSSKKLNFVLAMCSYCLAFFARWAHTKVRNPLDKTRSDAP